MRSHGIALSSPWIPAVAPCAAGVFFMIVSSPAVAQITPDSTLGSEGSIVLPDQTIKDLPADLIQGGAARGSSLFHSFLEFNVNDGQRVYFDNPSGIDRILSRVTGSDVSDILGTLGVNGGADLFFLNPNGIIFGPNARLDINGSFTASAGKAFVFSDGTQFSGVDPAAPPLLTVNVAPGLQLGQNYHGNIDNAGRLEVGAGKAIILHGQDVTQTGSLKAPGGVVGLLGQTVGLLENASIDVSGLNGGGLVLLGGTLQGKDPALAALRTYIAPGATIKADAIESGDGGTVVVWSDEVTGFYGNISARGAAAIDGLENPAKGGFVEVSSQGHLIFRGDVDTSTPFGESGVVLLDPTTITIANGTRDSAGDGTDWFAGNVSGLAGQILSAPLSTINDLAPTTIYESELEGLSGNTNIVLQATDSITIADLADNGLLFKGGNGSIVFAADANADGVGDVTMLDLGDALKTNGRNLTISGVNLTLGTIDTSIQPQEVLTTIDINTGGLIPAVGTSGPANFTFSVPVGVGVISDLDVRFSAAHTWDSDLDVFLISPLGSSLELFTDVGGSGDNFRDTVLNDEASTSIAAGTAPFNGSFRPEGASGLAIFDGGVADGLWTLNIVDDTSGDSGRLFRAGDSASWGTASGTQLLITSLVGNGGHAGSVDLGATGNLDFKKILAQGTGLAGSGGSVTVNAGGNLSFITIDASSVASDGGNVSLIAGGDINLGIPRTEPIVIDVNAGGPIPAVGTSGPANFTFSVPTGVGVIRDLDVRFSAAHTWDSDLDVSLISPLGLSLELFTDVGGSGQNFRDTVLNDEASTSITAGSAPFNGSFRPEGVGGLAIFDGGIADGIWGLNTVDDTFGDSGALFRAGDMAPWGMAIGTQLLINGGDRIEGLLDASGGSNGNGGEINLDAGGNIRLLGMIKAQGQNDGGDIRLNADQDIILQGSEINVRGSDRGSITIHAQNLDLLESSKIRAGIGESLGSRTSQAGDIDINVNEAINVIDSSFIANTVSLNGIGNAGDIVIHANDLYLDPGSAIVSSSYSLGDAGNIFILDAQNVSLNGGGLLANIGNSAVTSAIGKIGNITIESDLITLANGMQLQAGLFSGNQGEKGLISLQGNEEVRISESQIFGNVDYGAIGNGSDIIISAPSVIIENDSSLTTSNAGVGDAGNILIESQELSVSGTSVIKSNIGSAERTPAIGKVGTIRLEGNSILFSDSQLQASVLRGGTGTPGLISVQANEKLELNTSNFFANVDDGGSGDASDIELFSPQIFLTNDSDIFTNNSGIGQAGQITVDANTLKMKNRSDLLAFSNNGDAGLITLDIKHSVLLDNDSTLSASATNSGQGGSIYINTGEILIRGGSHLFAPIKNGTGGEIIINAADLLEISGFTPTSLGDPIASKIEIETLGDGDAGDITINTSRLLIQDGGQLLTNSLSDTGIGVGGDIIINATDSVELLGSTPDGLTPSGIQSSTGSEGDAGNIQIKTGRLSIQGGAKIDTASSKTGNAGNITINALESLDINGFRRFPLSFTVSQITAETTGEGDAGLISVTTPTLSLSDSGRIVSSTSGAGNASSIAIHASDSINLGQGSLISVETNGVGRPGSIDLVAPQLLIGENAQLSATATSISTNTEGGGDISLSISDLDISGRLGIFAETNSLARAGDLTVQPYGTDPSLNITFRDNGFISASTTASGDGGSITLTAPKTIDVSGQGSIAVTTSGSGTAGTIQFTAPQINLSDGVKITGKTTGTGIGGTIFVDAPDRLTLTNARLETQTQGSGNAGNINLGIGRSLSITGEDAGVFVTSEAGSTGNSGSIVIQQLEGVTGNFTVGLSQGATLSASKAGQANAGSVRLLDIDTLTLDSGTISTEITETGRSDEQSNIEIDADTLTLDNNSEITADTHGIGNAGNIDLSTVKTLTIAGGSSISSVTSGLGDSGDIDLSGTQTITSTGGTISTAVLAGGVGEGGSITIATDTLDLINTNITSSTAGTGDTGTIAITARQGATLEQGSTISTAVETGATGNAQQIEVLTPQLSLDQSQITASTSGTGNAGRINLTGIDGVATQQIDLLNNSAITTAVNAGAVGNAGQINLATRQLTLNGSQIASSTDGQGRAGRISAQNVDTITLDNSTISTAILENGTAETLSQNDRGNITLSAQTLNLTNSSNITARTAGFRDPGFNDAGQIDITTATTTLNKGSAIQTNTAGSGTAGDINLIATEGLFISGTNSGIFSSTEEGSTGNAGNITIDPPIVDIRDGAGIAVNSFGSGLGGNITLFAGDLNLTNNAFISALTRSSGGGNITLTIGDQLVLRDRSFISTEAGTAQAGGNGGNINLTGFFIIGFKNSDIVANAYEGNGGSIDITTNGLFGFLIKNVDNPFEDPRNNITASSRFGASGTTNINNTVDPAQGLGTLPGNLVDPSSLIDRRCAVTDVNNLSRFSITGRGGLPANPSQLFQGRTYLEDLGSFNSPEFNLEVGENSQKTSNGTLSLWTSSGRSISSLFSSKCL